jgi:hypothetical protein
VLIWSFGLKFDRPGIGHDFINRDVGRLRVKSLAGTKRWNRYPQAIGHNLVNSMRQQFQALALNRKLLNPDQRLGRGRFAAKTTPSRVQPGEGK